MFSKFTDTYFFTATILKWQKLLQADYRKEIIIEALNNLCNSRKISLHAFVIMPNHLHLLLSFPQEQFTTEFQIRFLRYTAQAIIKVPIGTRIMEQRMINQHGLDNLLNIRNSIAPQYWWIFGIRP